MKYHNMRPPSRLFRFALTLATVALASVSGPANAQNTVTTLYQQDFETLATGRLSECKARGGALGGPTDNSGGTLTADYNGTGAPNSGTFAQVETADRVCWNNAAATRPVTDQVPPAIGGKYSGGFARNQAIVESWALSFDPVGKRYLNGQMNLAHITPGNLDNGNNNYPGTAGTVYMWLQFFKIPATKTFTLSAGSNPANNASDSNEALLKIDGVTQTPLLPKTKVAITKQSTFNRYTADWNTYAFSVDAEDFLPGDKVAVVATAVDHLTYIVFDNIVITAADEPTQAPGITKAFAAPKSLTPGATTALSITVSGDSINAHGNLQLTDTLPAPLVVAQAPNVVNGCAGTLSAVAGSDSISLTNGTLPAAGCTLTVDVTWPRTPEAIAQCTPGSTVTNTIKDDGAQFSIAGVTTQQTDATDTLACVPAPVLSINCTPQTLYDRADQQSQCRITSDRPVTSALSVAIVAEPSDPSRATNGCTGPLTIPAGAMQSGTCTIIATDNETPLDGNASVSVTINDAPTDGILAYTIGKRSENIDILNDDQPPVLNLQNTAVPTSAAPNEPVQFTIVASNSTGVTVRDGQITTGSAPVDLVLGSWTCSASGAAVCPALNGSGAIMQSGAILPAGGALTYVLNATVAANAVDRSALTLDARVTTATAGATCVGGAPMPCAQGASVNVKLLPPVLGITNQVTPDAAAAGEVVHFVIDVLNGSSTTAITNASLTTDTPEHLSLGAWTCTASGGATCPAAHGTGQPQVSGISLPVGGKLSYSLEATIDSALNGASAAPVSSLTLVASFTTSAEGATCTGGGAVPCAQAATVSIKAGGALVKATPVPTLNPWAVLALSLLLTATALGWSQRRNTSTKR